MAISTIKFIGLALRDALCSAWDFFIYFIKGKDSGNDWYSVLHDVWATLFEKLGLSDWAEDEKMFAAARREKNQKYNSEHKPSFGFKPDTLAAMDDMGKSFSDALTVALNTLAGTDAGKLYDNAYSVALDKLLITIQTMEEAANKNEEELKKVLEELKKDRLAAAKENAGMAAKGFSDSGSLISKILGDADSGRIRKIRDTMNSLNVQFEASNNQIERLSEQLKSAKTATEIESIFDSINEQIERIGELTAGARGLEEGAARAKKAFDLLQGSLQAIGEAGQVIEMIMSSNVIGLIVVFLSKLAGVFSNLSGAAAAASNIITFLFDIITEIIQELTPFLDMLFRPLLEIVAAVGRIIGQLLNLLVPVLGLLTGVAQQFNLLTPILNTVAILLAIVTDCFGLLWNAVSWLIKNLTFGLVNMGRMQTDNYQKMVDSINAEQNYDSYKNNSTSYTVSGDLYIYIYYEHSYVNGDARDIALNLRDEIRAAEREGY
jgi:hypothetical protein